VLSLTLQVGNGSSNNTPAPVSAPAVVHLQGRPKPHPRGSPAPDPENRLSARWEVRGRTRLLTTPWYHEGVLNFGLRRERWRVVTSGLAPPPPLKISAG
jgi:hypothetical protein